MSNETQTSKPTPKFEVEQARLEARDHLRKKMINDCLNSITEEKSQLPSYEKDVENAAKKLEVAIYNVTKIDIEHPQAEQLTKDAEENVNVRKEALENCEKNLEQEQKRVNKALAEIEEKILKVENGDIKMSLEDIHSLANDKLKANFLRA